MKKQKLKLGAKAGTYSAILTVIVIAAAVIFNLVVAALPSKFTKIDTSAEKIYTFSAETERFVSELKDDVLIYYVCEEGMEDTYLSETLDKYKEMSPKISVEQISPTTQPGIIEKYTDATLTSNSLIVTSGDVSKVVTYNDIYYIYCEALGGKMSYDEFQQQNQYYYSYYGMTLDQIYYQQTGTQLQYSLNFSGESAVLSSIDYVTSEALPKIYVLGAGESVTFNSVLTSVFKQENFIVESLALFESNTTLDGSATVKKDIPADADTILIMGLTADLTDDELTTLQEYVKDGGNLIVATDYTSPKFENLRKLAASYGLDISSGIVFETDSKYYSGANFVIKANKGEDIASNLSYDVYVPRAHGIKLPETMPEGMSATKLLYTNTTAYAKPLGDTSAKPELAEGDIAGEFALAVKVNCEGAGSVSWFSSNYYLLNDFPQSNVDYKNFAVYNYAYAYNLASTCGKAETISVDAVELSGGYLSVTEGSANLWGIITIGIVPLAFIGVGFAVWARRRSK